jgi:hypothetical protein
VPFLHDSTNELGGSLLGDGHWCGQREVIAGLYFVCVGTVNTWGYEGCWGDLILFLDDEESRNRASADGLVFLSGQGEVG